MMPYSLEDLLPLMKEQVRKYTSNESTSVPYSTAQSIMESIIYAIEAAFQTDNNTENTTEIIQEPTSPKQAYQCGYDLLKEKIFTTQNIFKEIEQNFCGYQNLCYKETILMGIPAFFQRYDLMYDATHSIITLDYPLLKENRNLTGIHLIFDYLVKTQLEQDFLHLFYKQNIQLLLYYYDNNFNEAIFNLCRIVLTNALGCLLSNKSVYDLLLNDHDRSMIYEFCIHHSQESLQEILLKKLHHFIQGNYGNAKDLLNYFSSSIKDIVYEIRFCCEHQCLTQLFPKHPDSYTPVKQIYTEGVNMDDTKLRNLVEEMSNMRHLSDKIILVQRQVKSLSDLKEILKECFFSEEWISVFSLLTPMEKDILHKEIYEKATFDNNLEDWEIVFLEYCKKE